MRVTDQACQRAYLALACTHRGQDHHTRWDRRRMQVRHTKWPNTQSPEASPTMRLTAAFRSDRWLEPVQSCKRRSVIPSRSNSSMQVPEQRHHVPLVSRSSTLHPLLQVLGSVRGQQVGTIQLAAPHPLQEGPIPHPVHASPALHA